MPDRIVRQGILTSDKVNTLSWQAEVFYRRLHSVVDDYGLFDARVAILRAQLYPLQISKVSETDIGKWLQETETAGLVRTYVVDGRVYLEVVNFGQRLRQKRHKFPVPPTDSYLQHPADNGRPESESEVESERKRSVGGTEAPPADGPPKISDAQWLGLLKNDPAYEGLDVDREHAKMQRWCETNHRKPSRRRFVNWLNRVERPMQNGHAVGSAPAPVPRFAQIKALESTIAQKTKELPGVANRNLYPDEYEADIKRREPMVAEIKELKAKLADLKAQEAA